MINEINGVNTHPTAMLPIFLTSMFLPPFANPIPIIAPTTACDCDTGTSGNAGRLLDVRKLYNPSDENTKRTSDVASTTMKALIGESLKILSPTVNMTLLEYVNTPMAIAIPPSRNNCCTPVNVIPLVIEISLKGDTWMKTPITFAILFAPKLYAPNAPAITSPYRVYLSIRTT